MDAVERVEIAFCCIDSFEEEKSVLFISKKPILFVKNYIIDSYIIRFGIY